MFRNASTIGVLLLALGSTEFAAAQEMDRSRAGGGDDRPSLLATARASDGQVRFAVLGLVRSVRLEVWDQAGGAVFDSRTQDGSLLDWKFDDGTGNRLPDGLYGCMLTFVDLQGRSTARRAALWLRGGSARFGQLRPEEMQSSSLPETQDSIAILGGEEPWPLAAMAHDGRAGRIVSGKGGMSFRTGDLFSGQDVERMRLTEDGRLGVGVDEPAAKLDVGGLIRTTEGIMFPDGTIQRTAARGSSFAVFGEGMGVNGAPEGYLHYRQAPQSRAFVTRGRVHDKSGAGVAASGGVDRVYGTEDGSPTYNTYYGDKAGDHNIAGVCNSFFGYEAGTANSTGRHNSFFGNDAGQLNQTGNFNSFFGTFAGSGNVNGSNNSFYGYSTGWDNNGSDNAFFGYYAGSNNSSGYRNSFFGSESGEKNTTGYANSFFGNGAGYSNTTAPGNAFFGYNSGHDTTTGYDNSFMGADSGRLNTTGKGNSFFGHSSGFSNTTGFDNAFFGMRAGYFNTAGSFNAVFGYRAGYRNTSGNFNSLFGWEAGYSNTTGDSNAFFGQNAGYSNSTGSLNSLFGASAGSSNTEGKENAFFGAVAGYGNTMGSYNSIFGTKAGYENSTGGDNSFFGHSAGIANSEGNFNSFFGLNAGMANTTGSWNAFFGLGAGLFNTTEHANSYFGSLSNGVAGITNAAAIGYRAQVTQSDSLVLGGINGVNGATADTRVGIGTTAPSQMLEVRKDQNGSTYIQVTNQANYADSSRARIALVGGTVVQEMQSIAGDGGYFGTTSNHPFRIYTNSNTQVTITARGDVGIGYTNPGAKLHVNGNLKVTGAILYGAPEMDLPDYVFEPDYRLMPIERLEEFVAREKHLPGVPPARELQENGINLGEFQMRLLEKIEELTLYAVGQAKTIRQQQQAAEDKDARILALENRNNALEARLAAIEQMLAQGYDPGRINRR